MRPFVQSAMRKLRSSQNKGPNSRTIALYCGVSVGIGILIGYVAILRSPQNNQTSQQKNQLKHAQPGKLHKTNPKLVDYVMKSANRFIPELQDIHDITYEKFPQNAGMMTSKDQCYLFKWLMSALHCSKAIEIGVYTGSSALCIAKGLPENGKLIAIDVNKEYTSVAQDIWKKCGVDHKIELKLNGGINALNQLISDEKQKETFDFAYIDAIKTEYIEYYEKLLLLMKKGGVIAFDNVLQRGNVAKNDSQLEASGLSEYRIKNTKYIKKFNQYVRNDKRVEMCLIAIGDGLTLVYIK